MKTIEGVCSREILVQAPCPRLEDLATAEVCRGVRIISYKDFVKALSLALPRFTNGDSIRLRQAAWHGERLFWAGERQACAFAAAIVYARRRELELKLPAHLERYELEPGALDELEQRYHMLRIPTEAWSEPTFMSLLLDTGLPYARLALFTPETSHELSIDLIGAGGRLGLNRLLTPKPASLPVSVLGLEFPNPVGLAAGLDKNGDAIDGFGQLGFGFIEIGTVTPRPQPGNPRPRLFRLPQANAIINRMGFNNHGVDHLLARVRAAKYRGVLGINIGKNFDTPVERAVDDYLICLDKVYADASYVTVNVSSPNTPGLRSLQFGDSLKQLLEALRQRQEALALRHGRRVPLAIKIAPDMTDEETALVAAALVEAGMDAVIATNTTLGREGVEGLPYARLALFTPETPECLLLPRNDERADALGEGLRAAGAADVVKYLKQL